MVAFFVGAVGTLLGTVVAYALVGRQLGPDGWKVAAALCASYIGGLAGWSTEQTVRAGRKSMLQSVDSTWLCLASQWCRMSSTPARPAFLPTGPVTPIHPALPAGGALNFAAVSQALTLAPGPLLAGAMTADNCVMGGWVAVGGWQWVGSSGRVAVGG